MIKGSVKIPIIRSGSKLITAISSSHKEPLIVSNAPLIETQVSELDKDYYPAYPPNLTERDFSDSISSLAILAKLLNKSVSDNGLSSDLLTKVFSKDIVDIAAANYYLSLNLSIPTLDLLQTSDSAVLVVVFDRVFDETSPSSDSFYKDSHKALIDTSSVLDLGISSIGMSKSLEDIQLVEDDLIGEVGAGDDLVMLTSKGISVVEAVSDDFQTISDFYRNFSDNQSSLIFTAFDFSKNDHDQTLSLEYLASSVSSLKEDLVDVSYEFALNLSTQFSESLTQLDTSSLDFNKALEDATNSSDLHLSLNSDKTLSELTSVLEDFSRIVDSQRQFEDISAAAYNVSLSTSLGTFVESGISLETSKLDYIKDVSDNQSSEVLISFDVLSNVSDQTFNLEDLNYGFNSLKEDSVNVNYNVALNFSTQFLESLTQLDTSSLDFNKALEDATYIGEASLELNHNKVLPEDISAAAYNVSLSTSLGTFVESGISLETSKLDYIKEVSDNQASSADISIHNFKVINEAAISQDFTIITLVLLREFSDNQLLGDSILINNSKVFIDNQSDYQETLTAHKQDYISWDYFSEAYTGTITSL